jgi:ribosomal protein S27AE
MSDDVMLAQLMAMRKQVDALILMVRKQIDLPAGENGCTREDGYTTGHTESVTVHNPRCTRCGRKFAYVITRPYRLKCPRCGLLLIA